MPTDTIKTNNPSLTSYPRPSQQECSATYCEGESAYLNGTAFSDNPYGGGKCHGFLSNAWVNGWVDKAREDGHEWNASKDGVERRAIK